MFDEKDFLVTFWTVSTPRRPENPKRMRKRRPDIRIIAAHLPPSLHEQPRVACGVIPLKEFNNRSKNQFPCINQAQRNFLIVFAKIHFRSDLSEDAAPDKGRNDYVRQNQICVGIVNQSRRTEPQIAGKIQRECVKSDWTFNGVILCRAAVCINGR